MFTNFVIWKTTQGSDQENGKEMQPLNLETGNYVVIVQFNKLGFSNFTENFV